MTMHQELVSVPNIYHSTVNEFTISHPISKVIQDGLGFLYMWRRIKCYDWKLCFLDSRNCYCRYLDTNVALETHISLLTDAGKTKFVSQCFSQILGEACLPLANTTIY